MSRRWYVVRSHPRAEYMAASELDRAGVEVVLPRIKTPHSRLGHIDEPLFPGYLFIRCDLTEEAPPFHMMAPHVSGWVNFGGIVPSVPDDFVDTLQGRLERLEQNGGLWRQFQPGEKVRIVSGHIQDWAEVLEEPKSPQGRVKVLLNFMGRMVQAQVPWEYLTGVEEDSNLNLRSPRRTRGRGRWIQGFGNKALATT